jgi:hypothetical protein
LAAQFSAARYGTLVTTHGAQLAWQASRAIAELIDEKV